MFVEKKSPRYSSPYNKIRENALLVALLNLLRSTSFKPGNNIFELIKFAEFYCKYNSRQVKQNVQ